MKILHITVWPGPPFSGQNVNCHNFLKRLAPRHPSKFIIVAPNETASDLSSEKLAQVGIPNEGISVISCRDIGRKDQIRAILFTNRLPYVAFWEQEIGRALRELSTDTIRKWNPDVIVVWFWPLAAIVSEVQSPRKVLYACDSVSLGNRLQGAHTRNPLRKIYHWLMNARCVDFEQSVTPHYQDVVFISRKDADNANVSSSVRVWIINNGVDTSIASRGSASSLQSGIPVIVFHGFLSYPPNAEAVSFLVKRVGPYLEDLYGSEGFEIRVVGGGATKEHQSYDKKYQWFKLEGYVESLNEALVGGSVYVAPMSISGGVNNKVLDAMNCGLPVVGSVEAFSGLDIVPGIHCVQCPLQKIPEEVALLLEDEQRRYNIREQAQKWIINNADWDIQADKFDTILNSG